MTTNLTRRGLLGAFIAAPAIVRASSLMPVRSWTAQYGPLPVPYSWSEAEIEAFRLRFAIFTQIPARHLFGTLP